MKREELIEEIARRMAWSHGYFPEKVTVEELRNLPMGGVDKERTADLMSIAEGLLERLDSLGMVVVPGNGGAATCTRVEPE